MTKGRMVRELKKIGVRKGVKVTTGALVALEHLKYSQVAVLYYEHFMSK